jgi:uncharacterized protein involved in exopolysaccharide biosynthesis/Mrp family chromosome partitioning ATPase
MTNEYKEQEKSIRDILYILFKHKGKVIFFFILSVFIAGVLYISKPDMYISSAKITMKRGKASPVEMVTGISIPTEIFTENEILQSRGFAELVVEKMGADKFLIVPEDRLSYMEIFIRFIKERIGIVPNHALVDPVEYREKAIKVFIEQFEVIILPRSNTINLSYKARTPELAQEILTKVIESYADKHIEVHTSASSLQFLEEETERLRLELSTSEEKLREFRNEIDIVSLSVQQKALLEHIDKLQEDIEETEADINATSAAISTMQSRLDSESRESLRDEEVKFAALNAKFRSLKEQIGKAKDELKILNDSEEEYNALQRSVIIKEENYKRYLDNLEQARIAQTLESQRISNISLMQSPTFIAKPVSQERKKTIGLTLFMGLVMGIGLAFLIEYFNHTIKKVEDVERLLKTKNVVSLPPINFKELFTLLRRSTRKTSGNYTRDVVRKMTSNVTYWLHAIQEIRISFEDIKNLLFMSVKDEPKKPYVIAITSCYRGEGVSTIALGVAYSIAQYDKMNVLFVDSSSHQINTDRVLGVNRPPGLFEIKLNKESVPEDNAKKLKSVLVPKIASEEVDYFAKNLNMDSLLPTVHKHDYQYIILDLPSLSEGGSGLKSAGIADGVILVIEAEKVRREVAIRTLEKLEKVGATLFGVVINKRQHYIPEWLYAKA